MSDKIMTFLTGMFGVFIGIFFIVAVGIGLTDLHHINLKTEKNECSISEPISELRGVLEIHTFTVGNKECIFVVDSHYNGAGLHCTES